MRRRSRAGGKSPDAQAPKAAARKRRIASKAVRSRGSSIAREKTEVARLTRALNESLEQQTATSEILRVISNSKTDIQPVFEAIAASAMRLCDAVNSLVIRFDGRLMHLMAHHNVIPERLDTLERLFPLPPSRASVSGRSILSRVAVQVEDITLDREYMLPTATTFGYRTALAVPMLHDDNPIGVIVVARDRVAPFSEKQIALLQTFANQAVIAIENVRLFEAEQQRTRELTESLEQQTATANVLGVISSSPGDLQPVFASMLENAVRICDATFGNIHRWDGQAFHLLAMHNAPAAFAEARGRSPVSPPHPISMFGHIAATKSVIHITDATEHESYLEPVPSAVNAVEHGGVRAVLGVPMLRESELIGAFTLFRQEVRPFTDKQIEWSRTLLPKPSSPLRTRGCLASCVNRCSNRPRRLTY